MDFDGSLYDKSISLFKKAALNITKLLANDHGRIRAAIHVVLFFKDMSIRQMC
jgi:hypothetical protein